MAELTELGKNACAAKYILQKLTTEEKNKALDTAANYLCDRQAEILAANEYRRGYGTFRASQRIKDR